MPHELLSLTPFELSLDMACMAHGLAALESDARRLADASRDGLIPLPVPTIDIGGR